MEAPRPQGGQAQSPGKRTTSRPGQEEAPTAGVTGPKKSPAQAGLEGQSSAEECATRCQAPRSPDPVSVAFTGGGLGDHRLEIISPVSGPTAGWAVAAERTA